MPEILPTNPTSINKTEARRRLDELAVVSRLAHEYARVERGTEYADGTAETDGDHVVHLGIMAVAYALKYRPDLDPGRIALYALLHDLDEAKVGDTPTLGAGKQDLERKYQREAEGRQQIETELSDFPELLELLCSMDRLERPEDRFGKGFDKLAPGYMHKETDGRTLAKFGVMSRHELLEATAATDAKMREYSGDHPDIVALREAMHERVCDHVFGPEEPGQSV